MEATTNHVVAPRLVVVPKRLLGKGLDTDGDAGVLGVGADTALLCSGADAFDGGGLVLPVEEVDAAQGKGGPVL